MKTRFVLVFTFMMVRLAFVHSQCPIGVQHFYTFDSSTLVTSTRTQMSCCVWGNEYLPMTNIVAGNTYTFDTCGATNNTTLTLFDPNDDEVAFSENECSGSGGLISNFVANMNGTYKAQVNTQSCGGVNVNTAVFITLEATLNTKDIDAYSKVAIYPNPSSDSFRVLTNSEIAGISLYDVQGKTIKTFNKDDNVYNIKDLTSGIYFVNIKTNDSQITKKLIKQ